MKSKTNEDKVRFEIRSVASLESHAVVLLRLADLLAVLVALADAVRRAEVALHVRVEYLSRKVECKLTKFTSGEL